MGHTCCWPRASEVELVDGQELTEEIEARHSRDTEQGGAAAISMRSARRGLRVRPHLIRDLLDCAELQPLGGCVELRAMATECCQTV